MAIAFNFQPVQLNDVLGAGPKTLTAQVQINYFMDLSQQSGEETAVMVPLRLSGVSNFHDMKRTALQNLKALGEQVAAEAGRLLDTMKNDPQ